MIEVLKIPSETEISQGNALWLSGQDILYCRSSVSVLRNPCYRILEHCITKHVQFFFISNPNCIPQRSLNCSKSLVSTSFSWLDGLDGLSPSLSVISTLSQ